MLLFLAKKVPLPKDTFFDRNCKKTLRNDYLQKAASLENLKIGKHSLSNMQAYLTLAEHNKLKRMHGNITHSVLAKMRLHSYYSSTNVCFNNHSQDL